MRPLTTLRRVSSSEIATPPALSGCTERTVEYTSSVGAVTELNRAGPAGGGVVYIRRAAKKPMAIKATAPNGCHTHVARFDEPRLKDADNASRKSRQGPL